MSDTILLIDDSPSLRVLTKKWLTRAGFKVLEAADGEEGLRALLLYPEIKVVLLDMMMPKMNGMQFLEKCKMAKDMFHFKVCMLTAKEENKDVKQCLDIGADDYMVKPADESILIDKVKILAGSKDINPFYSKQINLAGELMTSEGKSPTQLDLLSENTLVFTCKEDLPISARVFIESPDLGKLLGTRSNFLLRVYSSERKGADYRYSATFVALKEDEYKQIRSITTRG